MKGMYRRTLRLVTFLLLATSVAAADEEKDRAREQAVTDLAATVKRALSDNDYTAFSEAAARAVALRPKYTAEEFDAVARAIGKGFTNKDTSIALLGIKTTEKLGCLASCRYLTPLLSPPKNPSEDRYRLHLAAIEAAGAHREPKTLPSLEKLVSHPNTEFAVAATRALGQFAKADRKIKLDLVRRLADTLGRFEKKRPRSAVARAHLRAVKAGLIDCLRKLAGEPKLETAGDARKWLRKQPKAKSKA